MAVLATRLIASQLNAVNRHLHDVAGEVEPEDWLRRAVPGTSLPAFTLWHVARVIDSTVNMGLRGVPEVIESQPWASKRWARAEAGVGYSETDADRLAAGVVPDEILEYADAVRSQVSQWLKTITEEELDSPNALLEHAIANRLTTVQPYMRPWPRSWASPCGWSCASPATPTAGPT